MSLKTRRVAIDGPVATSGAHHSSCRLQQVGEAFGQDFCFTRRSGQCAAEAAKSGDQNAVLAIFGPESKEIIYSGDAVQDKSGDRRIRGRVCR